MQKKAPDGTSPEAEQEKPAKPRKRGRRRFGLATFFSLCVAVLVFFVLSLALTGKTVKAPEFLRAEIEERLNNQLSGAPFQLGEIQLGVDRKGVPQLLMNNIRLADQSGGAVAELNWLGAELSVERLLKREFAAERVFLTGAQITVRRTAAGRFTLAAGNAMGGDEQSITDILAKIDEQMTSGSFASLSEVVAGGIVLTLEDARSGRIWQATNASATLRVENDVLSMSITSDVFNGTDDLAGLQLSLIRSRETGHVQLGATVDQMPANEIAAQSPVLSWLRVLDAPISGSVRTELDEDGVLSSFAGTLDIASGALKPNEASAPLSFNAAKAYFTFDPTRQRIDFSQVSFNSDDADIVAAGHTYLTEFDGLWPGAYLGQFEVESLAYRGGDTFDGPIELADIQADLRVRLDPFTVELAQVSIDNEGVPVAASGRIEAGNEGWAFAIDATTPEISSERVLQFWPRRVSPISRAWLSENLRRGHLRQAALGLRILGSEKPDLSLSFEFEDGLAKFLPNMPELENASGLATLHDYRFALELAKGRVIGPSGEDIDLTGSQFAVIDTRPKPSWGEINVAAKGKLDQILSVLDNEPLRLMERAERPPEIAEADVTGTAKITIPLKDGIRNEEVSYEVSAELRNVSSEVLVPGRVFTSNRLNLSANTEEVGLSGPARLDGVDLTARWVQPLGEGSENGGKITGQVSLSAETVEVFDLPLPDGLVRGEGRADYALKLPADPTIPPELSLSSDLRGLDMGLGALGWRKPPSELGEFSVIASLGEVPDIEAVTLKTDSLNLEGTLDLGENGSLRAARFQALELGDWLDAAVELTPSPNGGPPQISVRGGTVDLRQLELAGQSNGGSGTGPISLSLDRLTVSDGISFAPLRGQIRVTSNGLSGNFDAQLNGRTSIQGVLSPANAGTAIRITSSDAAGVLRDSGLTPNARHGSLDLVLTPVAGAASGTFDGEFLIEDIRLKDAPAMADLLDAVSVVGLLDQLGGPGIRFDTVDGQFRMNRSQIRVRQAAAVGPSMGISADGIYDLRRNRMDFQGVVSPVYFLNGIGSFLTRRGEGLFGFNYRMAGPAAGPSVGVNPLSILTPGAFRQIFRRAPPGG